MQRNYRTSTFCAEGSCVGVAPTADGVVILDTDALDGPALHFSHAQWAAFLAGVKAGEFDWPDGPLPG